MFQTNLSEAQASPLFVIKESANRRVIRHITLIITKHAKKAEIWHAGWRRNGLFFSSSWKPTLKVPNQFISGLNCFTFSFVESQLSGNLAGMKGLKGDKGDNRRLPSCWFSEIGNWGGKWVLAPPLLPPLRCPWAMLQTLTTAQGFPTKDGWVHCETLSEWIKVMQENKTRKLSA